MQDEIDSLHENKTWIMIEKQKGEKVISSRWVFATKLNSDDSKRCKARLVKKVVCKLRELIIKRHLVPLFVLTQ